MLNENRQGIPACTNVYSMGTLAASAPPSYTLRVRVSMVSCLDASSRISCVSTVS